ncbi:Hypothetical protein FKW44_009267 [Caligus rogercresseyi]|uniref:Uncharacterized protein n=1 Tax=Caligus rogercresseyi TaxID=217165 RepID=A0A7T8HF17_CALRO|nr:Hypothetical protein FKW44_009267 [Caligus rogercresseyi]
MQFTKIKRLFLGYRKDSSSSGTGQATTPSTRAPTNILEDDTTIITTRGTPWGSWFPCQQARRPTKRFR